MFSEKSPHIYGPVQFEPMLSKGQLHFLMYCWDCKKMKEVSKDERGEKEKSDNPKPKGHTNTWVNAPPKA